MKVGEEVRPFWLSPVGRYLKQRIKQSEDAYLEISANTEADTANMAVARTNYIIGKRIAVRLDKSFRVDNEQFHDVLEVERRSPV